MDIAIDAGKCFDKIQLALIIKSLKTLGIDRIHFNIIKVIYNTPIPNIILNGEKQGISSKARNETSVCMLPILIPYSIGIPYWSQKIGERNKMDSNKEKKAQNIHICR
jgi:hypothetical protein